MSGDVHRRHPATPVFAAALACALVWLGLGSRVGVDPPSSGGHLAAGVVVAQPAGTQFAQRATARLGHLRAAVVAASQRHPFGTGPSRAVVVVLVALLGLGALGRRTLRRHAVRMHGVRAPPSRPPGSATPLARA